MGKRLNGRKVVDEIPPVTPLVEAGGQPVPLPPLNQLHADGMPGGTLHKAASESEAGFMTPEHIGRISRVEAELEKRPPFEVGDFAAADHDHPPALPEHSHSDLMSAIGDIGRELDAVRSLAQGLSGKPSFDPSQWAKRDHSHAPSPLPAHDHPQYEEADSALEKKIEDGQKYSLTLMEEMKDISEKLAGLEKELKFVRDLAEKAIESKSQRQKHGHLGGGALHELANDRLAGFMSVENRRRLDVLWEERGEKTPTGSD